MLKIDNLQYQYKNTNDTYTYTLEAKPAEVVAILGASGSGKSTLLDLVAGFIKPSSGSVKLDVQELLGQSVEQRPMTILFQKHNLFEHLSVMKNILLGVQDKQDKTESIKKILIEVGLEGFENRLASELSGGQQQRVALARVLMRREPILLLDEPFSGLDDATRIEMLELVQKITQVQNLHTIMITHDKDDCERIANHVYEMQSHTLVQL